MEMIADMAEFRLVEALALDDAQISIHFQREVDAFVTGDWHGQSEISNVQSAH